MHYSATTPHRPKPRREFNFEIGDSVELRTNPRWIGTVVSKSLSTNVNVLWESRGIEQVDSRLLQLANRHA
jgi:hypothetical protein